MEKMFRLNKEKEVKEEKVLKSINKLLHDFSSNVILTDASETKSFKTYEAILNIKGIHCPNCAEKIKQSVLKLSEVVGCEFDFKKKLLKIVSNQEFSNQLLNA